LHERDGHVIDLEAHQSANEGLLLVGTEIVAGAADGDKPGVTVFAVPGLRLTCHESNPSAKGTEDTVQAEGLLRPEHGSALGLRDYSREAENCVRVPNSVPAILKSS
jgi:hypothetical protein